MLIRKSHIFASIKFRSKSYLEALCQQEILIGLKYGDFKLTLNCFYPKYFNLREQLFKILIKNMHHLEGLML